MSVRLLLTLIFLPLPAVFAQAPVPPHAPGIESKGYVWNDRNSEIEAALKHRPDLDNGAAAYRVCQGCHLANGAGRPDADLPSLAGQHRSVLIKQLVDVRSGRRDNPKMHPFAAENAVSTTEIADISAWLASLPVPTGNGRGDGKAVKRGQQLYERDCALCHGDAGEGDGKRFYPRLSGQHFRYLVLESKQIRDGVRRNGNPRMVKAIKKYTDQDIEAVSDYLSRLELPAR